ncbi:uncharacterized protein HaLaN_14720 [Haematococcus lacustris]|uniref:Uncharacterized protein n=1 Tax=Haematococcus lacustris TaxID=44745 RepID=A0A699ZGQ9_HAELA|nr:uncharacterized protein HaLaN_14720 [Haematococcus lacustris]
MLREVSSFGRTRAQVVARSFLGVGAPEALLVGVVALVVFGPKGLAEAAKSVGQTLRAFQPTIREVVEVSQDIKGTLEKELGLNEIREASRSAFTPTSSLTASRAGVARSSFDDLVAGASTSTASASQQGNGTAGDNSSSSSSLDGQGV